LKTLTEYNEIVASVNSSFPTTYSGLSSNIIVSSTFFPKTDYIAIGNYDLIITPFDTGVTVVDGVDYNDSLGYGYLPDTSDQPLKINLDYYILLMTNHH
jgi:hypothetical protein